MLAKQPTPATDKCGTVPELRQAACRAQLKSAVQSLKDVYEDTRVVMQPLGRQFGCLS